MSRKQGFAEPAFITINRIRKAVLSVFVSDVVSFHDKYISSMVATYQLCKACNT